jgi:hypothetical protein
MSLLYQYYWFSAFAVITTPSFDGLSPLACSHSEFIWKQESYRQSDGGSALSQGRYLHRTTQTHKKRIQTSVPQVGFEPTMPVFGRSKTSYAKTAWPLLSIRWLVVNLAFGCLHHLLVESIVDVSEVHIASIFRLGVCTVGECIYRFVFLREHRNSSILPNLTPKREAECAPRNVDKTVHIYTV